jgi:hypothetical protein
LSGFIRKELAPATDIYDGKVFANILHVHTIYGFL